MLGVVATKRHGTFKLDVAFELPTPGVVALFGRSGCGKSTLVNIIAGLVKPDTGRVTLDGTALLDTQRGIRMPVERRRLGYVFQGARLFPHLTVAGNLRFAEKRATGPEFVGLDTVVSLLDLLPLMNRRTNQLSGGERQRVAIGRALLTQPRLLLLDEPLTGLDRARRAEVLPYLETLRDQISIPMVYVTHDFDEVLRLATHLVLMDHGSVIAQGGIAEMSLDPHLRSLVGRDEIGAVIEGRVLGGEADGRLTRVGVGHGELHVRSPGLAPGAAVRVQVLARDVIVSTGPPRHLSVRNHLAGRITQVLDDDEESDLIVIDVGGVEVMSRITHTATRKLSLETGMPVWALVKTVALRVLTVPAPTRSGSPDA